MKKIILLVLSSLAALACTAQLTSLSVSVCKNTPFTLYAPTGDTYLWDSGTTTQMRDIQVGESAMTYTVTVTSGTKTTEMPFIVNAMTCMDPQVYSRNECPGANITLSGPPNALSYLWSNNATTPEISLNVSTQSTYKVTATLFNNLNLIENGDFELGADFGSNYTTVTGVIDVGNYAVTTSPSLARQELRVVGDHTYGTGNMLVVDGAPTGGLYFWEKTIRVKPNTDYALFYYYAQATSGVDDAPARVYSTVDGVKSTESTINNTAYRESERFLFNSGNKTAVTIRLWDAIVDNIGNNFIIDDITLLEKKSLEFTYNVKTKDCTNDYVDVVNNDTVLCLGDSVYLHARTNGTFKAWKPASHFKNDSLRDAWVKPSATTRYVATAVFFKSNIITNGDFEMGNSNFSSSNSYDPNVGPGKYFVGRNPMTTNPWFKSSTDHSGSGNMMIIDGGSNIGDKVYATTVAVTNGTDYVFSAWVKNINGSLQNPPSLRFYIGSTALDTVALGATDADWVQFSTTWKATSSGNIEISLQNQNIQPNGNDFALDDIVFANFETRSDSITVTVNPIPTPALKEQSVGCDSAINVALDPGLFDTYDWGGGYKSRVNTVTSEGTFTVTVTSNGCAATATTTVSRECAFDCNGDFYLSTTVVNADKTTLNDVDFDDRGQATITAIGAETTISYNAIGFNFKNNYVYAFSKNNKQIIRISRDGTYKTLGTTQGLPTTNLTNNTYYIADCDTNGHYVLGTSQGQIYVIDVFTSPPTLLNSNTIKSSGSRDFADFAFHPISGELYYFDRNTKNLYRYNLTTQTETKVSVAPSTKIDMLGSVWFNSFGDIYAYGMPRGSNSQTTLFKISTADGSDRVIATGPAAQGTDGASCAFYVDMTKTADRPTVNEGDTVSYIFTVSNSTRAVRSDELFVDTLPAGLVYINVAGRTLFGDQVKTKMTTDGSNRQILYVEKADIPMHFTHFTLQAKALCVDANTRTANSAYFPDLLPKWGGPVVSDDSTTILLDDPAIVNIINAPVPTASVDDSVVCVGESFTLSGTYTGTDKHVSWAGPDSIFNKPVVTRSSATLDMSGWYDFIARNYSCPDTARVHVRVNPLPQVQAWASTKALCLGDTTSLGVKGASTYQWSPTATAGTPFTPKATTTYTVTGTDTNACKDTSVVTITINPLPKVTVSPVTICSGDTATLHARVTTVARSYSWSTNMSLDSIRVTPSVDTVYSVTVTDEHGCKDSTRATVSVKSRPAVSIIDPLSICKGDSTTITAQNALTYVWDNGLAARSSNRVSPAKTTTYWVTGTDSFGCVAADSATVIVNEPLVLKAKAIPDTICLGNSSTLQASDEKKTAKQFSWDHSLEPSWEVLATPDSTTTYTVVGTDLHGCKDTTTVRVFVNMPPTVTATASVDSICPGDSVTLTASGANTYYWNTIGKGTSITVSPLAAHTYYVIGYDKNECIDSTKISVGVYALPHMDITPKAICPGDSALVTATGAKTYTWKPVLPAMNNNWVSPATTTTYVVQGVDAHGCVNKDSATLVVYVPQKISASATPGSVCVGGVSTLVAQNEHTYLWSNKLGSNPRVNVSPNISTTYTVMGTDGNGCKDSTSVHVTVNPLPVVSARVVTDSICRGTFTTIRAYGANTYWWNTKDSTPSVLVSPTGDTRYFVVGTDSNGCVDTSDVMVHVRQLPEVTLSINPEQMCQGDTATAVPAGAQTYVWSPKPLNNKYEVSPAQTTIYTIIGDDGHGCKDTASARIVILGRPTIEATATPDSVCIGLQSHLVVSGARSYTWDDKLGNNTYIDVTPAKTSIYVVRGFDANGCTDTAQVSVTVLPLPQVDASVSRDSLCPGESTTISARGARTYSWNNNAGTTASATVSPQVNTTYFVTGTDIHGCIDTSKINVSIKPLPRVVASADAIVCHGGADTVSVSGTASSYLWNTGLRDTRLATGSLTTRVTYHVTGTLSGCTASDSVSVDVRPQLSLSTSPDASICPDSSVTLSASGSPSMSFTWDKLASQSNEVVVNPKQTTVYHVVGHYFNCSIADSIKVFIYQLPTISASISPASVCPGIPVTVWASGGATYVWNLDTIENNKPFVPGTSGTFSVTGTDKNGCKDTSSVSVVVKPLPEVHTSADTAVCHGVSAHVRASGTASSYVWNQQEVTGAGNLVSPRASTRYSVTGTLDGCKDTASMLVTVYPPLSISIPNKPKPICLGDSVTLGVTGNLEYYQWDHNLGVEQRISVSPDTSTWYRVKGNYKTCHTSDSVLVTVNYPPVVSASTSLPKVCKGASITVEASTKDLAGNPVVATYLWSNTSNKASFTDKPINNSWYEVTASNPEGCWSTASTSVLVDDIPSVTAFSSKDRICLDDSVMVFATSSADVTYRWIPNIQPRVYFKPSQTATYLVIATNQGACSDSARVKIEVTFPPTVTATVNEAEKCLGGYVVFRASGANTFTWSDKITSGNNFYPTASKYYHVTGTDANGCRDNDSVYVKVFNDTTVTANILSSDTSVCLGRPVKVWASGATSANEKYEWSNGVQDNVDFLLTQPGRYTYVVTGTSPTGCRGVDSVSLRVKPIPPPPSVSSDTICHYNALPLLVAKGKAIKWYDGSSRLLVYAGDTLLPRKHDPGTYTWRLTQEVEGCVSHDSVTSTLYIVPNYKGLKIVTADTTLCEFPKHKSTYAASGTQGNLKWNVTSKAWTHDSRDSSIIGVQWTAQGVDTITLSTTDKYGCSYYTSQVVSIAPYPTASFEAYPNPTMSRARFINLSDSSVIKEVNRRLSMRYEWNFGRDDDKMKGVISRDTLVKYPYGYYDVTLVTTNEFGCSDTISQNIFIDILTNLYVPTAFSPTDRCPEVAMFLPKGFNLKTYNVKVFDTWGNLLWYSDKLIDGQPLEGWDGTYDGVMMKSDVYVWKIEAQFNDNTEWHGQLIDNGTVRRFGSVMLIR